MQCLSAPTREEVNIAHSKGKYFDIGLPSVKNLRGWRKSTMFSLLILSTLPLHFLWNSAVFTTSQRLDYAVFVVTPSFFSKPAVDCSQNSSIIRSSNSPYLEPYSPGYRYSQTPLAYHSSSSYGYFYQDSSFYWWQKDICNISQALQVNSTRGELTRLDNEACINAYGPGNSHLSGWSNVLVVTKYEPANPNKTILLQLRYEEYISNYTGDSWLCSPNYLLANNYKCNYEKVAANSSSWALGSPTVTIDIPWTLLPSEEWPIDYCLAQPSTLNGMCQLQYSLTILICVLIANALKFSCIVYFLRKNSGPILVTVGDAVASFLELPDPNTVNRPFMSRKQARRFQRETQGPAQWKTSSLRWWNGPSLVRWIITVTLCTMAIVLVSNLLITGNRSILDQGGSSPYSLGFGTYNTMATVYIFEASTTNPSSSTFSSNTILMTLVAVANLPQVLVSCLYFAYNIVYTSMVSADEWSRFTTHKKGLRTTSRKGDQRSTYWLSLPWTYALPLAVASSILHWLISQSLFIARSEVLDTYGDMEPISYMQIGFSPLAILAALLFGSGMVLCMIFNGLKRLQPCILVGNNSLAIAAACYRTETDFGAELKRVQWGAVSHQGLDGTPGHCCFTSGDVESPRVGDMYV